jgi:hypothetical protein
MKFPTVKGDNLARQTYQLPQDFEGDLNLVFVAFQQVHQLDVNTWLPLAKALAHLYPGLRYYELPTIRAMNFLARAMIDGGMRAGIPDRAARAATITLYIDKAQFRRALAIPDENSIHVFLVDGAGEVVWRAVGRCTEANEQALRDAVAAFFTSQAVEAT